MNNNTNSPNQPSEKNQMNTSVEAANQNSTTPEISAVSEDVRSALSTLKTFEDHLKTLLAMQVAEKVNAKASIEEERLIDKQEAMHYLLVAAQAAGIDLSTLEMTEQVVDSQGNLIYLEAKYTDPKTGNFRLVSYQIKRADSVDETNVDVSNWEKDSPYPDSSDVMTKYVNGQWFAWDESKPKGQKWVLSPRS